MFGHTARQTDTDRKIEDLSGRVAALSEAVAVLSEGTATLQADLARLQKRHVLMQEMHDADAACLEEMRIALSKVTERFETGSDGPLWLEELRLALKALSARIDWEAHKAYQAATALHEQVDQLRRPEAGTG